MKALNLLLALILCAPLAAGAAPSPNLLNCTNGGTTFKVIAVSNTATVEVNATAGQDGQQKCQPLGSTPANWFVKYTLDGGATWAWQTVAQLTGGAAGAPSTPLATTAAISWTAPTTDTAGAALTVPLSFNVYRGSTAANLTLLKNVSGASTTDTVTASGTYWYAVSALNGTVESAKSDPISAALASGTVITPAPPTQVTIK